MIETANEDQKESPVQFMVAVAVIIIFGLLAILYSSTRTGG